MHTLYIEYSLFYGALLWGSFPCMHIQYMYIYVWSRLHMERMHTLYASITMNAHTREQAYTYLCAHTVRANSTYDYTRGLIYIMYIYI